MARRCRHSIPQPAYGGLSARAVNVIAQEETRAVLLRKTLMAYARDMQEHVPRVFQRDYSASPLPAVLRGRRLRDDAVFRAAFFLGAEVSSPVTEASAAGAVVSAELSDVCAAFFLVFFAAGLRGSRGLRR